LEGIDWVTVVVVVVIVGVTVVVTAGRVVVTAGRVVVDVTPGKVEVDVTPGRVEVETSVEVTLFVFGNPYAPIAAPATAPTTNPPPTPATNFRRDIASFLASSPELVDMLSVVSNTHI